MTLPLPAEIDRLRERVRTLEAFAQGAIAENVRLRSQIRTYERADAEAHRMYDQATQTVGELRARLDAEKGDAGLPGWGYDGAWFFGPTDGSTPWRHVSRKDDTDLWEWSVTTPCPCQHGCGQDVVLAKGEEKYALDAMRAAGGTHG